MAVVIIPCPARTYDLRDCCAEPYAVRFCPSVATRDCPYVLLAIRAQIRRPFESVNEHPLPTGRRDLVRSSAERGLEGCSGHTCKPRKLIRPDIATLPRADEIMKPSTNAAFHAAQVLNYTKQDKINQCFLQPWRECSFVLLRYLQSTIGPAIHLSCLVRIERR